jgi:protein arginine kinase
MGAETASTVRLQKIPRADVTDQISRAFGLLLHSYQLQTKETINALSLLKLGLSLGMISGITPQQIHALFFLCRRPHLAKLAKVPSTDPQELAHERAAFLHKELKNALLKETT